MNEPTEKAAVPEILHRFKGDHDPATIYRDEYGMLEARYSSGYQVTRGHLAHEGSLTIHLGGRTFSFFGGALDTAKPEE